MKKNRIILEHVDDIEECQACRGKGWFSFFDGHRSTCWNCNGEGIIDTVVETANQVTERILNPFFDDDLPF